jgi:CheY-like chemotaxis protein
LPRAIDIEEQVPLMMALTSNEGVRVLVRGRTLLLADDSATIRKVVELTFSDEGLEVVTVADGQQALDKLDEIIPDIVLADIFMPAPNGYEVCEHIKRSERFRHIPVMLLVGSFEPFDEAEARRVGADDYLTKPFQSIRALVGKVRDLMSGSSGSEEATTRKLTMPPETKDENRLDEEAIKRSTADTAPLLEQEQEEMLSSDNRRQGAFTDLSMDDQMIEETPANDYGSAGGRAHGTQEARPTAAYSTADLQEAGINQAVENKSASEQEEEEGSASDAYAPAQIGEPSPVAAGGHSPSVNRTSTYAGSDDSLLDLGDIESPTATTEADDFFLDLLDESPEQSRSSAPLFAATPEPQIEAAPASSTAEELDAQSRADYEEETAEVAPQVLNKESRAAFEQAEEFAHAETEASTAAAYNRSQEAPISTSEDFSGDMQLAPTERLPDNFQAEKAPSEMGGAESTRAAIASPATGQITLDQLSPEVIDAIARRAVEQLSERVVEQIAWEVVPDLAELLIKRRLEEGNQ